MRRVRVLVIEDQPLMREGLETLIASSEDATAVGVVDSGDAAIRALASCTADVVMLDLDLGGEDGLEVIPRIAEVAPGMKVLAFTALRRPRSPTSHRLTDAASVLAISRASF